MRNQAQIAALFNALPIAAAAPFEQRLQFGVMPASARAMVKETLRYDALNGSGPADRVGFARRNARGTIDNLFAPPK